VFIIPPQASMDLKIEDHPSSRWNGVDDWTMIGTRTPLVSSEITKRKIWRGVNGTIVNMDEAA
jgi:hypothetical protein